MIVLTEWQDAAKTTTAWARAHGYQWAGGLTDALVLTRTGLRTGSRPVAMGRRWWWRSGRRAPRDFLAFTLDGGLTGLGVHFPPGGPKGGIHVVGGRNKAAWAESAATARQALRDGRFVIGDLNALDRELRHHITDRVPGTTVAMTGKVDGCLLPAGWRHRSTHRVRDNDRGHGWGVVVLDRTS